MSLGLLRDVKLSDLVVADVGAVEDVAVGVDPGAGLLTVEREGGRNPKPRPRPIAAWKSSKLTTWKPPVIGKVPIGRKMEGRVVSRDPEGAEVEEAEEVEEAAVVVLVLDVGGLGCLDAEKGPKWKVWVLVPARPASDAMEGN